MGWSELSDSVARSKLIKKITPTLLAEAINSARHSVVCRRETNRKVRVL
jgi:hypothetical protein